METLIHHNPYLIFFITPPLIIITIYLYCSYKLNYWTKRGVKQLKNTSMIFGNFKNGALFRTGPGFYFGQLYRDAPADAAYTGFYIFHKPCLLLRDPQMIKQIMIRDFSIFTNRHFAGNVQKDSFNIVNLFGVDEPAWSYMRKKISPSISRGKLKHMLPMMMENAKPMMDYINKITNNDKCAVIDLQNLSYRFSADLIANVALGNKNDSFNHPNSTLSKYLMEFFNSYKRRVALLAVFFAPELVNIFGSLILFNVKVFSKVFWKALNSREKSGEKREDFIDAAVQLKNGPQNSVYKFEGENLMAQSGTFLSGFESSAITTTFTLMELAKNKECQDKARQDIKQALAKHGWSLKAFDEMKYLNQCISESVRMHPPISTLDRYPTTDYQLPNTDLVIEKGTPIFISMYGLHYDPKYFEDPEVYRPERFDSDRVIPDAYVPYGIGPRMCAAVQLGQLHVKLVVSMILNEFEVCLNSDFELDNRFTFTAAAVGIDLKFTKLSSF